MALTFNAIARAASFSPSQAFPLDARSYFESKDLAVAAALTAAEAGTKAASNTVYYIGQTLVVNENSSATLYIIQPDKTLKEVGAVPMGDGKSIEVVDGKIKLKGFGSGYWKYNAEVEGKYEFVANEFKAGLQPQIVAAQEGEGFEIAWFEPNPTTVEGLQSEITALSGSVNTLSGKVDTKANAADVYTKTEADEIFATVDKVDAHINKVIADAVNTDTLENLTQLVQYVNEHDTEIITDVANIEKQLGGIDAGEGTVKKYVDDAISGLNIDSYATDKDVIDLTAIVNGKANASDVYTKDEIDNKGFLTEHQNLDHKADKTVVDGLVGIINGSAETEGTLAYQLKQVENKIPTTDDLNALIEGKNHVTSNQLELILADYVTDTALQTALTDNATQTWVNEALKDYTKTADLPADFITSVNENEFTVTSGKLDVKAINVNKLVQTAGEELVLNGGSAAKVSA